MIRHLAASLVIAVFTLVSQPASAAGPITTYDTVDAVEVFQDQIIVTGIIAGQSSPSTTTYKILSSSPGPTGGTSDVAASRCDRLALLAASKPGKYQFAMTFIINFPARYSCKLVVRTP